MANERNTTAEAQDHFVGRRARCHRLPVKLGAVVVEDVPRLALAQIKDLPSWPAYQRQRREVNGEAVIVKLTTDTTSIGIPWWLTCPRCSSRRLHLHLLHGRLAAAAAMV